MNETSPDRSETAQTDQSTTATARGPVVLTELDKFRIQQDAIRARSARVLF